MNKIGTIISYNNTPNVFSFSFQVTKESIVRNNDFIFVRQNQDKILGKIINLTSTNEMFSDPKILKYYQDQQKEITNFYSFEPLRLGEVQILGALKDNYVTISTIPPIPGDDVYKAENDLIALLLKSSDKGLKIGTLDTNSSLDIFLDPDKLFLYHFAVLGTTGTGKSYTNGVIVEETIRLGIPIIIFDPHGEYSQIFFDNSLDSLKPESSLKKTLFLFKENLNSEDNNKFLKFNVQVNEISFVINEIPPDYLAELLNCNETQSDLLVLTIQHELITKETISVIDLISKVELVGKDQGFSHTTIKAVTRRLYRLLSLNLIGNSICLEDVIIKNSISIVDLSNSYDDYAQRVSLAVFLVKLFKLAKEKKIPPSFIIVEEAHIFAPQNFDSVSKFILRKISREGRKFGLGLNITSQRIIGIDKDILSQCNTKIILRIDSKTDLDYLLPYISIYSGQDQKIIPQLTEGTALISGFAIGLPSIIKIRQRITTHGGNTPKMIT